MPATAAASGRGPGPRLPIRGVRGEGARATAGGGGCVGCLVGRRRPAAGEAAAGGWAAGYVRVSEKCCSTPQLDASVARKCDKAVGAQRAAGRRSSLCMRLQERSRTDQVYTAPACTALYRCGTAIVSSALASRPGQPHGYMSGLAKPSSGASATPLHTARHRAPHLCGTHDDAVDSRPP